mgnify:CR=1 FL=1
MNGGGKEEEAGSGREEKGAPLKPLTTSSPLAVSGAYSPLAVLRLPFRSRVVMSVTLTTDASSPSLRTRVSPTLTTPAKSNAPLIQIKCARETTSSSPPSTTMRRKAFVESIVSVRWIQLVTRPVAVSSPMERVDIDLVLPSDICTTASDGKQASVSPPLVSALPPPPTPGA